jgi:hypothetical protein
VITRKTDYELEKIPRAIYNDPIDDLLLREEGYSGKPHKQRAAELQHLKRADPYAKVFDVAPKDPEPKPLWEVDRQGNLLEVRRFRFIEGNTVDSLSQGFRRCLVEWHQRHTD